MIGFEVAQYTFFDLFTWMTTATRVSVTSITALPNSRAHCSRTARKGADSGRTRNPHISARELTRSHGCRQAEPLSVVSSRCFVLALFRGRQGIEYYRSADSLKLVKGSGLIA